MVTSPAARQHHYNHFWQSALAIWFKILHFTLWGNEKPMKMQFPNSTSILQEKKKDNSHPLMMFRWGWTQTQLEIVVRWSNKQLEEKIITTFHSELGEAVHPENRVLSSVFFFLEAFAWCYVNQHSSTKKQFAKMQNIGDTPEGSPDLVVSDCHGFKRKSDILKKKVKHLCVLCYLPAWQEKCTCINLL